MNNQNLFIASLVGAVVSLFIVNVPILNLSNSLLCFGFWGSAILASGFTSARPIWSRSARV